MKAIHPKWYSDSKVTCACGNSFTIGSTVPEITVDVCSKCHPFYSGKMKYIDVAGRVDAFKARTKAASKTVLSKKDRRKIKKERKIREELEKPDTLEQLRKKIK